MAGITIDSITIKTLPYIHMYEFYGNVWMLHTGSGSDCCMRIAYGYCGSGWGFSSGDVLYAAETPDQNIE